ncbi:SagB/ThcOx family dehydrogenase [Xanthobacter autotrophicus]|uniref:SagB/ThcOx family dehydrogenase n=1 Tax=Xanthobacter autotrophicus TaxID=280 RepID=UPI00372C552C
MNAAPPVARPAETALAYHARTKHSLKAYAAGPETLDWDAQPNPFREFEGCPRLALPLAAEALAVTYEAMITPGAVPPAPLDLAGVALLLELSFGLAGWKQYGPDRWAVRCNPSSGNLHPTEAYVLASNVAGVPDGLHHYVSRDHVLEQRFTARTSTSVSFASASGFVMERSFARSAAGPARLHLVLSSVHWREAWKYGERAFRYCQLDLGHALAGVRYAAACLGWSARMVEGISSADIARLGGFDREEDFAGAEREDPDILIQITPGPAVAVPPPLPETRGWVGQANVLDRHKLYRWPVIDAVSAATHGGSGDCDPAPAVVPALPPRAVARTATASAVILGRRSAQRFEAKTGAMPQEVFFGMLEALMPGAAAPFDAWGFTPRIHPLLFVHRVEGLAPGLYALPRREEVTDALKAALRSDFQWVKPEGCPEHLPLYRLVETDCRGIARTISCHQAIASDSSFALAMLSEFEATVSADPWRYRQLHWEAGLVGQVLYLEAEAAGFRGTGIGCFFDDDLHRLVGLESLAFQSLYHFTVGRPAIDTRITTEPAYPGRSA